MISWVYQTLSVTGGLGKMVTFSLLSLGGVSGPQEMFLMPYRLPVLRQSTWLLSIWHSSPEPGPVGLLILGMEIDARVRLGEGHHVDLEVEVLEVVMAHVADIEQVSGTVGRAWDTPSRSCRRGPGRRGRSRPPSSRRGSFRRRGSQNRVPAAAHRRPRKPGPTAIPRQC